jgi:hypothetical protein
VSLRTGLICWLNGGYPGSVHDLTMARQGGITEFLKQHEFIFADKGYIGDNAFLTPVRSPTTFVELLWNYLLSIERTIVEHVIGLKIFACLAATWRHELILHPVVVNVVAQITNIDMCFFPVLDDN